MRSVAEALHAWARKVAASRVGVLDRGNVPTQPTYDPPRQLVGALAPLADHHGPSWTGDYLDTAHRGLSRAI